MKKEPYFLPPPLFFLFLLLYIILSSQGMQNSETQEIKLENTAVESNILFTIF